MKLTIENRVEIQGVSYILKCTPCKNSIRLTLEKENGMIFFPADNYIDEEINNINRKEGPILFREENTVKVGITMYVDLLRRAGTLEEFEKNYYADDWGDII